MVHEREGETDILFLASEDIKQLRPVTIGEVLPSIGAGDTRIRLSTGDVFTVDFSSDITALEPFFPRRGRFGATLSRLEMVGWRGVILLSVIFVGLLLGFRLAIAPVGDLLAKSAPTSLVERGSGLVLAQLDMTVLQGSSLPASQRQRLIDEFDRMRQLAPPEFADTRLHFRKAPLIGPNAFALPGNDVVLLDDLVTFADDEAVVLAVLAHEFGHVIERHALRQIMRSAVVAMGVSLLVGAEDSILEEIVGEFTTDYSTTSSSDITRLDGDGFLIDGTATIRTINKTLNWSLPTDGPKTLNGLITEHLEFIPDTTLSIVIDDYRLEVRQVKDDIIKTVRAANHKTK